MKPEELCEAVANAAGAFFNTPKGKSNHNHVDAFQNALHSFLNNNYSNYYVWTKESKNKTIPVSDRVDVKGTPKSNIGTIPVIIEIDSWRADQVAKKFISRTYLYSIKGRLNTKNTPGPMQYVAILYKQKTSSLTEALKFVMYSNKILKNLNRASSCVAIFFDKTQNNNFRIVYYDPNKSLRFNVNNSAVITGMPKTAKYVVDLIAPHVKFNILQQKLTISNQNKSSIPLVSNTILQRRRMSKCTKITKDNHNVFVEHEWEKFGPSANWDSFVKMVNGWKKINVKITELFNHYQNKKLGNWEPI